MNITVGTPCAGCARPLRPTSVGAGAYPGTVIHRRRGLCKRCSDAGAEGVTPGRPDNVGPPTDLGRCRECDWPMRRSRTHSADAPGTRRVGRMSDGLCIHCTRAAAKPKRPETDRELIQVDHPDPHIRHIARTLDAWLEQHVRPNQRAGERTP